jgi:hypothetical protein
MRGYVNTFEEFAKSIIDASPILKEEQIQQLLHESNYEPLERFLYRIAAYVVAEERRADYQHGSQRSDEAYCDAIQDCALEFQAILARARTHKLMTYAQTAFRLITKHSLYRATKGGMIGTKNEILDAIPDPASLEDLNVVDSDSEADDGDAGSWDAMLPYESPPIGYDDPMRELIRQETADNALRHASERKQTQAMANRLRAEIGSKDQI